LYSLKKKRKKIVQLYNVKSIFILFDNINLLQDLRKTTCKKSTYCPKKKERILSALGESNGILIKDTVTVGLYGTDNFTSISDAVAFAPNNSKPEDGYFVIYATEGYYEEYVDVPNYKKNIMLLGDGINRTVITGNHSVIDGWTTFTSSTFGK
jgi:pectinesterase